MQDVCGLDGEGVRERNYAFLFDLGGSTWVGFRSTALIGDLHAYRLDFDTAGGFKSSPEQIKVPVGGFDGAAVSLFGPAPWHRAGEECD